MGNPSQKIQSCEHICPTAILTDAWPLWFLSCLYFCTALFSLYQLFYRATSWRSLRFTSFRNMFLWLAFASMMLRTVLYTFDFNWTLFALIFVGNMVPIFCQFATFSLLILFIAKCQLIMQGKEPLVQKRLYPAYATVTLLFFLASLVMSLVISDRINPDDPSTLERGFDRDISLYSAMVFGTLVIFVVLYGYRTHKMLFLFVLSKTKREKVRRFTILVFVYFSIFIMRTLWDVSYLTGWNVIQNYLNKLNSDDAHHKNEIAYYISSLVFYSIVEVMPTVFLLLSFYLWLPSGPLVQQDGSHQPILAPMRTGSDDVCTIDA